MATPPPGRSMAGGQPKPRPKSMRSPVSSAPVGEALGTKKHATRVAAGAVDGAMQRRA